jgi:hypothetical protein
MIGRRRLLCLAALAAACEPTTLGRMCVVLPGAADAGAPDGQSFINDRALECRTQLCLQQAPGAGTTAGVDTAAFCTADCQRDSDCQEGERRDPGRTGDRRCRGGFYCGVPLTTGTAACRRLCLCRDFGTSPSALTCGER